VAVPGFLPDLPDVRLEIAEYYASVRRCDDTVGAVLRALDETGAASDTLVLFLSDNGMAFPFSKTNCYLHSTRTPFLARWPGLGKPGNVDEAHFVTGVDVMPTVLEAAGVRLPEDLNGRSFLALLEGRPQSGREMGFTQFHQTAAKRNYPMRCVQTRRFGYIFNPWSNGRREFRNESMSGRTMNAMRAAAEGDSAVASRVEMFLKRVPEEFYDFERDPDALTNLVDDPAYAADVERLRSALAAWMIEASDPALEAFQNRTSRAAQDRFMFETDEALGRPD
jgi:N-sulfoglucosamine sulfohydrolase